MTLFPATPAHWRLSFWLCLAAVLTLALLPPATPMPTTGWDKSNHLLAFATLLVLGRQAYPTRAWTLAAGLLAYGGLIEWLQSLTPYRYADWSDLLADAVGMAVGWALYAVARGIGQRRRHGSSQAG
ncbi:VanZ family protein [Cupriavidus gilardii J11]|uniref:VanZ family protein n=1 Tax=Cupriavidus gilardii J11 TaxID=936133 RepID=A0A562BV78_9BURK|nr:VanZ family protein [Cupriavidus gilardii]TWG89124.1 VanZ family protein [Cupriavidus gilardii J11]